MLWHKVLSILIWVALLVLVGDGFNIYGLIFTHSYPMPSIGFYRFNGFEMPGVTTHYSLGHWVVHATIGHAVGYIASSRLCFTSTLFVGWLGVIEQIGRCRH
jgi:hypothetical protein